MSTYRVEAPFELTAWDEHPFEGAAADLLEGPALGRVVLTKRYQGVIDGAGHGQVFTAQGSGGGGFVASKRVDGRL